MTQGTQPATARLRPWALAAVLAVLACSAGASDFAVEVVDYASLRAPWNVATNALGRPTIDTRGDGWDIDPGETVPVVPVYPPYVPGAGDHIVSINPGGHLTLKFDHPVEDDPANPYGLDFTVFGNPLQGLAGLQPWTNRNPNALTVTGATVSERGLVSVSQDGVSWHAFTNGPYADTFAPTLGRQYDTAHPDMSVGIWNKWWGAPADPTVPHDPRVAAADYAGMTVAAMCRCYRASAGGTGFDLGAFTNLPATSAHGWRWIQYVRISGLSGPAGSSEPEVDAVADVAPATPYELWRIRHFSWWELADPAVSGELADPGGNGSPNLLDYAAGADPRGSAPPPRLAPAGERRVAGAGYLVVRYERNRAAADLAFRVECASRLGAGAAWSAEGVVQEWQVNPLSAAVEEVFALAPLRAPAGYSRLRVAKP